MSWDMVWQAQTAIVDSLALCRAAGLCLLPARYGIQQALDLGADGVMVPLVNSREDAQQVSSSSSSPPTRLAQLQAVDAWMRQRTSEP
jgi:2-keto-3-deoxy-L-rhamnonate aldolase RhmA